MADVRQPAARLRGLTALVVEDDESTRLMLRQLLESLGAKVIVAAEGYTALKRLRAATRLPDVVLLDLRMPGLDGLEVARRIRRDPRLRAIPIIAVTAYSADRDYLATMEAGFDAHIPKPIDLDALVATSRRVVEERTPKR